MFDSISGSLRALLPTSICVIRVPVRYLCSCVVPLCVSRVPLRYFCSKAISLYSLFNKHLVFCVVNYSLDFVGQFTLFGVGEMKQDGQKERNNRFYFYVFILH